MKQMGIEVLVLRFDLSFFWRTGDTIPLVPVARFVAATGSVSILNAIIVIVKDTF